MQTTTETPAKNHRVARCHGYYAWPGGDPIGCPVCGGGLQTTTRLQRQQPWQVLDREEARQASRLPGGLPEQIAYARHLADTYLERAGNWLLDPEASVAIQTAEILAELPEYQRDWYEEGDRYATKGHSGQNVDGLLRAADKERAKAARLQRKLVKLGGPTEA